MWDDILEHLPDFESAVLTGVDEGGYPYSIRCRPQPDENAQVLRTQLPQDIALQPGRASLLCHEHDENLWNLKSFMVRGDLRQDGLGWSFYPEAFLPGTGGGLKEAVRFIAGSRRRTNRYLRKRGLSRPVVPWKEMKAIKDRAGKVSTK